MWSFIVKSAGADPTNRSIRTIMRAMLASARQFERDGYRAIVDFSIPPWYLDAVTELLKGVAFDYVVLRPSEAVCAARAAAREPGNVRDYSPYRELYVAFESAPAYTVVEDGGDPAATAARIARGVRAGEFRFRPSGRANDAPGPIG